MFRSFALLAVVVMGFAGCGSASKPTVSSSPDSVISSPYLLKEEPADAMSVVDTKSSAKDGEEVTLVGRIGGSQSPFVAGRASFTVVDTSFVPCNERAGDSCPTPWDYCCDTDRLPKGTAVVKVVDADGKTLPKDAKRDLGMKELQTIVVKGTAKRDEAGNLTILVPGVYVKK